MTDRIEHMNTQSPNEQEYSVKDMHDVLQTRMQKITTALYLVSDLLSDTEPLKVHLRNLSVETLASIGDLSLANPSQGKRVVTEIQNLVDQINDTLSVCVAVGFISDMNFKLLTSSLAHLRDDLNKKFAVLNGVDAHKASFLNRGVEEFTLPQGLLDLDTSTHKQSDNQNKKTSVSSMSNTAPKAHKQSNSKPPHVKPASTSNTAREQVVLQFIQQKQDEVSVSEVAELFPETSEKTIQRLLVKMVEEGTLTKTGEKRWSRYRAAATL